MRRKGEESQRIARLAMQPSFRQWIRRLWPAKRLPCGCPRPLYKDRTKRSGQCAALPKRSILQRLWHWLAARYERPSKLPFAKKRVRGRRRDRYV